MSRPPPRPLATRAALAALAAVSLFAGAAVAEEGAVQPGEILIEPATPQALGFRWTVAGDADGDASVSLSYRPAGDGRWRRGPDLFRVGLQSRQPKRRPRASVQFSGSLVGLRPDTEYELRLHLRDPDGGGLQRSMTLKTAGWPLLPEGLRRRHVVPRAEAGTDAGQGTRESPFRGLAAALAAARPGDLLALAPGVYRPEAPLHLPSGTADRPIVVQGEGPGAVVLDGGGGKVLLNLSDREQLWVRSLLLRNAQTLILANRARHLVVQGNRFEVEHAGYVSNGAVRDESLGHFLLDNQFRGPTRWPRSKGIEHIFGLALSGSGHVVAHNLMEDLGDCIRGAWAYGGHGLLSASDIHHNDLVACTDDGIEVDHADANVRVFGNRITNSFAAISLQPIFGGPVYLYRNRIYNTLYAPFKLHNNTAGVFMVHNTSIRAGIPFFIRTSTETVRDSLTRNNLFVGTDGPALTSTARMIGNDFDADGYAWHGGPFALWNGATYPTAAEARASGHLYRRFGASPLQSGALFAEAVLPLRDQARRFAGADNRPLLAADSPALDRGVPLPGFNDDFLGAAPDLGCCEQGAALPAVGPRPPYGP